MVCVFHKSISIRNMAESEGMVKDCTRLTLPVCVSMLLSNYSCNRSSSSFCYLLPLGFRMPFSLRFSQHSFLFSLSLPPCISLSFYRSGLKHRSISGSNGNGYCLKCIFISYFPGILLASLFHSHHLSFSSHRSLILLVSLLFLLRLHIDFSLHYHHHIHACLPLYTLLYFSFFTHLVPHIFSSLVTFFSYLSTHFSG